MAWQQPLLQLLVANRLLQVQHKSESCMHCVCKELQDTLLAKAQCNQHSMCVVCVALGHAACAACLAHGAVCVCVFIAVVLALLVLGHLSLAASILSRCFVRTHVPRRR